MYSKISGTIAAVLLISSIALAQTYSIRVTHYTNLRASHSLQSRVVETAPAGTTLAVVGSNGRWLQINRERKRAVDGGLGSLHARRRQPRGRDADSL